MTNWTVPDESPRASPERIRQFLRAYGSAGIRHADEFVPLMERNDPDETRIVAHEGRLDEGLRSTYRIRAKHLHGRAPSPYYPDGLADDVRQLSVELDAATDQPLRFWRISLPSGVCYLMFELVDDARVAGCVKSADQRVVNPAG